MRLDRKCFNGNFFNLKINYPPHPERVAWEYDKANKDLITKAINAFDRDKKLSERLFNETLLHVMSNFIQIRGWVLMTRSLHGLIEKLKI